MTLQRWVGISRLYPVSQELGQSEEIDDAVILVRDGKIEWVGTAKDAPEVSEGEEQIDLKGAIVTPGWVDCHTHLIWASSRQNEFRQRLEGKGYLEIAKAGGGIMSSCRAVRESSLEELVIAARPRLQRMISFGVTTLEIKSGYGLQTEAELRMLRAAKQLDSESPVTICTTFLGAHTYPTEYKQNREEYVDLVCNEMLPLVAKEGLASFCDIFLEEGAFSIEDSRRILNEGKKYGLIPRIHADQLSSGGGAELAAELGASSADHLEEISAEGIRAMAEADVVACLIPGSTFCLNQAKYAPAREMLDAGITLALSTDLNPGTTCSENLALMGTMACSQMRLLPSEVLHALTYGAAKALKLEQEIGLIRPGYWADFVAFDAPDLDYLFYHYGVSHVRSVWKRGSNIWSAKG